MTVAVIRWRGPISSLAGPMPDGSGQSLPIPTRGAICGLIGAAMGFGPDGEETHALQRSVDLAVIVHDAGKPFTDFQTADLKRPRMAREQLEAGGRVVTRGGALDKERAIVDRPLVSGFDATIIVGGTEAAAIDAALRAPIYEPYLGRRGCIPSVPLAGGIEDGDVENSISRNAKTGNIVWRLATPSEGLRFGVDLISLPERGGGISWWTRHAA